MKIKILWDIFETKRNYNAAICHMTRKNTNINFSLFRKINNKKIIKKFEINNRYIKIFEIKDGISENKSKNWK